MKNSKAYNYLIDQINATGSQKLSGYYPHIMEEIYDWERESVEDIIWTQFHKNNDTDLSKFLPKLKKYDGINALKESLGKCNIPSDNSLNIAEVLYNETMEDAYLEVFEKNLNTSDFCLPIVAQLSYCKPSSKLFDLLSNIYINDNDTTVQNTAIMGMLYCKKIINDPHSIREKTSIRELIRSFDKDTKIEREQKVKEFLELS